jgi:hypothetical protein
MTKDQAIAEAVKRGGAWVYFSCRRKTWVVVNDSIIEAMDWFDAFRLYPR